LIILIIIWRILLGLVIKNVIAIITLKLYDLNGNNCTTLLLYIPTIFEKFYRLISDDIKVLFYSVNKLREFIKRCIKIHSRIMWNRISYTRFFVRTVMWDRRVDSWRFRITENDIRWNISIRSIICAIIPITRRSWIRLREFVILEKLKIKRDRFRKCCSSEDRRMVLICRQMWRGFLFSDWQL